MKTHPLIAMSLRGFACSILVLLLSVSAGCGNQAPGNAPDTVREIPEGASAGTFGAGCFWCVEAVFELTDGVYRAVSGYMGGRPEEAVYEQVVTGRTGHAEVVRVFYDSDAIDYAGLLDLFWRMHDPTTLDRQGPDVGPQYRSVIFYHDETQRTLAVESREEWEAAGVFEDPIVTAIEPAEAFYRAEDYHQDYYARNPDAAYCRVVIRPKLRELGLE